MKQLSVLVFTLLVSSTAFSAGAVCPKASVLKMRVAKMKAIEKLDGYEMEAAEKLIDGGLLLATKDCRTVEHALVLMQLKGITRFGLKDYEGARKAFRALFQVKEDFPLLEKLANPRLVRYYNGLLAQYKAELKKKAETKAKIKKLEDAVGMPPEPKENTKVPLEHKPREKGLRGRSMTIFCRVMDEIKATKVLVYLKSADGTFKPAPMKKVGIRRYVLTLTGKQTSVPALNYYLMAFNAADRPVAASGNSATPHTVQMVIPEEKDTVETGTPVKKPETKTTDPVKKPVTVKKPVKGGKVDQVEDDEPQHKTDLTKEEPDEIKKARDEKPNAWDAGPAPMFQIGVSAGMGLGYISGKTEVIKDSLDAGFTTSKTVQFELGYMKTRRDVYSVVVQMGFAAVTDSDLYMEDRDNTNQYYFSTGMRNDLRYMLRYKNYSVPFAIPALTKSLGMRWRYFWGVGLGYGAIRHEAPAEKQVSENSTMVTKTFNDTNYSSGVMLNGFGGAAFCLTSGCGISLKAEVNYTATISVDDSNYAHFDFLFGFMGSF